MENLAKLFDGKEKLTISIASDKKSQTTIVRIEAHGYGSGIIIPSSGPVLTTSFASGINKSD